jgi:hypothetical protein
MRSKILLLSLWFAAVISAHADYFQAPDSSLHYLSHADVVNGWTSRLPAGSVSISDADAANVQANQEAASAPTLAQRATAELNRVTGASGAIIKYFAMGEAVPAAVSDYVKALQAIANGTDITSTSLPIAPAGI